MASYNSFEQLECWKASREVLKWVRLVIKNVPKTEFDLIDNITRAARSSTRNIAEGFGRFSYQENTHFCRISRGSLFEIIDDVITMFEDKYLTEEEYKSGRIKIDFAIKLINGYIHYLQQQKETIKK